MIRTIIIDDEPLAREVIREFLSLFPNIEIAAECKSGKEGIAAIERFNPDFIFLDVQMPEMTGFEMLHRLKEIPAVIFTTAYDQYAIRAFEINAVDYLLKPFTKQRFAQAVERALPEHHESEIEKLSRLMSQLGNKDSYHESMMVRKGSKIIPVKVSEIEWIEASDDYATLHLSNAEYLTSCGIGEMEKRLNPKQFVRVHRSSIINLSKIRQLDSDGSGGMSAMLESGASVKVSRNYASELRRLIV